MSYLLDTCIISKLRKLVKFPDDKLQEWIAKHDARSFFLSVITLGELQKGISLLDLNKLEDNKKRIILENWFNEELLPEFRNRILSITPEIATTWGGLMGSNRRRGIQIPMADGLIAATALIHNLTVVTENIRDFVDTGVRLYNPWI